MPNLGVSKCLKEKLPVSYGITSVGFHFMWDLFPHVMTFSVALNPVLSPYPSEPSTNSSLLFSVWLTCPGPGIGKYHSEGKDSKCKALFHVILFPLGSGTFQFWLPQLFSDSSMQLFVFIVYPILMDVLGVRIHLTISSLL